jgi:Transposase DDE domain
LAAQSPRLSRIAQHMPGSSDANYEQIQRFLAQADPQAALQRLFQVKAPFVIGDPTEIPRPQARKTEYVGTLNDGETKDFWLMLLATPYRGRALPCSFLTFSIRTLKDEVESCNQMHLRAFAQIKDLVGQKPLVLDRDFSYLELLEHLTAAHVNFVIRLNLRSHPPKLFNAEYRGVNLSLAPDETVVLRDIWYKGKVRVHLIGRWKKGVSKPLWVMTNLEPHHGLQIYLARLKIEESFRDLKSLLPLDQVMNKRQVHMGKMVALLLLAFSIGLWCGEALRDELYGPAPQPRTTSKPSGGHRRHAPPRIGHRWKLYSGLFVLRKQKIELPAARWKQVLKAARDSFMQLVYHPVRTYI